MGKSKQGISDTQAKNLKNLQYRSNELTFLVDHSKHCNLFNVTTESEHGKLIAIYYCRRCRVSKTFYFNV